MGNSSSTAENTSSRLPPGPFVSSRSDNTNIALRVGEVKRVGDRLTTTPQALINARLLYRAQSAAPLIDGYPELVGSGPARKSTLRICSALHVACEAVHRHCSLSPLQRPASASGLCKEDGPLRTLLAVCKEAVMPADDPSQGHILGTLLCHSGAVQAVGYLLQAVHTVMEDIAPAAGRQLDTNTEVFGSLASFSGTGAAADFRTCLDLAAGLIFCLSEWASAAPTLTDSGSPCSLCTPDFVGILLSYMAYSATANVAVYACDDILHTAHVNASKTVWSRALDQAPVDSSPQVSSAIPANNTTQAVDVAQQITQRRAQARALLAGRPMDTVLAAGTSAASPPASSAGNTAGRTGSVHITGPSLHQQALLLAARSSASGRGTFREKPSYLGIMGVSSILDVTRASGPDLLSLLLAMGPEGLASGSHVAALFAFEPGIQDPVKSPLLTTMLAMSRRVSQFSGDQLCLTSTLRGGASVQAPFDFLDMPSLADEVQLHISDSSFDSILHRPTFHTSSRRTGVLPAISQAVDAAVSAFCHAGDGILLVRLLALAATPSPPKAWKPVLTILANMQAHAGSRPQAPGHYAGGLGLNNPRTLDMLGHLFAGRGASSPRQPAPADRSGRARSSVARPSHEDQDTSESGIGSAIEDEAAAPALEQTSSSSDASSVSSQLESDDGEEATIDSADDDAGDEDHDSPADSDDEGSDSTGSAPDTGPARATGRGRRRGLLHQPFDTRLLHSSMGALSMLTQAWDAAAAQAVVAAKEEVQAWADTCARTINLDMNNDGRAAAPHTRSPSLLWNSSRIHVHTSAKEAAGVLHCAYPLEPFHPWSPQRRDRQANSLAAPALVSSSVTALHDLPTRRLSGVVAQKAVIEEECTVTAASGDAVDITPERLYIKRSTRYSHTASALLPAPLQHHWRLLPTILRYPDRPWGRHSGQAETQSPLTHGPGSVMAPGAFHPDPANAEPPSISLDSDERIMAKWERERLASRADSARMPLPAHPGREGYTHFAAHRAVYDHHVSSLPHALWHMRGQVQYQEQTSVPARSATSPGEANSNQARSSATVGGREVAVTQSRSSIAVPVSAAPSRKSIFSDADISASSTVPPVRAGAGREVQVQHSRSSASGRAGGARLTPTAAPFSLDGSHLPSEMRDMWRVQSVILAQSCSTHRADLLFLLWAIGQGGNRRQVQDLLVGAGATSVLARVVRATNWLRPLSVVKQDHVHGPNCKCGDRESAEVASWLRLLHMLVDRDSDRPDQTWWSRRRLVTTWELNAMYFDPTRPQSTQNESCLLLEALRASACTPSGWTVLVGGEVRVLPPGKEATYASVWNAMPAVPSQAPALYAHDPIDACRNAADRAYSKFDLLALDLEGGEETREGSAGSAGTVREAFDRSTRAERLHKNTLKAASAQQDVSCHPVATMPKEPLGPVAVLCAAMTAMGTAMATDNTDRGPSGVKQGSPTADFVHRGSIGMVLEVWLRQAPATARLWAAQQGRAGDAEGGLMQGLVWPMLQEAVMVDLVSAHGTSWLGVARGINVRLEDQDEGAEDSAGQEGDAAGEGQEDDPKKYDHQLMMDCLASLIRRLPSLLLPLERAQLSWLGKHLPSTTLRFASPAVQQAPCVAAAPHLLMRLCCSRTTDGSLLLRSLLLCEDWCYGLWQSEAHVNMGPYLQHGLPAFDEASVRTGQQHVTRHPWSWTALAKASQTLVSCALGSEPLPWPEWEEAALAPGLTCASLSFVREVRVPLLHTLMSRCATTQLKQDSVYVCTLVLLQLVIAHRHGALPGLIAALKRYDAAIREHTKRLAQGRAGAGPMRLPTLQDDLIVTTSEGSSTPMQLIDAVPDAAHLYGPPHGDGVDEGVQDVDGPVLRGFCRQLALWVSYTSLRDRDRRTLKLTSGYSWEEWRAVARAALGVPARHPEDERPEQAPHGVVGKALSMQGSGAPTTVPDLDGLGFGHSIVLERLPGEPHCSCSPHAPGCAQELHTGGSQPGLGVNRPLPHPHGLAAVHPAGQAYAARLHSAWTSVPAGLTGGAAAAYWSACALLADLPR